MINTKYNINLSTWPRVFGKGSQDLDTDWINLLSHLEKQSRLLTAIFDGLLSPEASYWFEVFLFCSEGQQTEVAFCFLSNMKGS